MFILRVRLGLNGGVVSVPEGISNDQECDVDFVRIG